MRKARKSRAPKRPWHHRRLHLLSPHWLSSRVQREVVKLGAPAGWRRAGSSSWRFLVAAWGHPRAYMWIIPLAVLALGLVPESWTVSFFDKEANARRFLEVAWQVAAAALALSVAVVVVALEVFSSRGSGSLQETIQDTGLLPTAYVGASALIVNGLVLSEVIRQPRGGPATLTGLLLGLALALLPALFGRASRVIDHAEILKIRARKATQEARLAVTQALFDRVAYSLLVQLCNEATVQLQTFLPSPAPSGGFLVRATRGGIIQDINVFWLGRLAKLIEDARPSDSAQTLVLAARVGTRVSAETPLLVLPPDLPRKAEKLAKRIVKL